MNSSKTVYGSNVLSTLFFSKDNLQNIQHLLRYIVFKQSGDIIDNQSENDLLIVMRSVFLSYPNFPPDLPPNATRQQREYVRGLYRAEIFRLNDIVVNEAVPKITSQLRQYKDYIRDSQSSLQVMDTPQNVSTAGQRQYRSVTQVLTGLD